MSHSEQDVVESRILLLKPLERRALRRRRAGLAGWRLSTSQLSGSVGARNARRRTEIPYSFSFRSSSIVALPEVDFAHLCKRLS